MLGKDLYIVTIETVFDAVRTSRVLLVPATDGEQANFKVSAYLMDLNWPVTGRDDERNWYISEPLREIDLLTLMSSSGAVRLGKDVDVPFEIHVPTPEASLAFKQEGDIDPEINDNSNPCMDCEEVTCYTCMFAYDNGMEDWDGVEW